MSTRSATTLLLAVILGATLVGACEPSPGPRPVATSTPVASPSLMVSTPPATPNPAPTTTPAALQTPAATASPTGSAATSHWDRPENDPAQIGLTAERLPLHLRSSLHTNGSASIADEDLPSDWQFDSGDDWQVLVIATFPMIDTEASIRLVGLAPELDQSFFGIGTKNGRFVAMLPNGKVKRLEAPGFRPGVNYGMALIVHRDADAKTFNVLAHVFETGGPASYITKFTYAGSADESPLVRVVAKVSGGAGMDVQRLEVYRDDLAAWPGS